MTVQKGGYLTSCAWENTGATDWKCLHDGGDARVWYGKGEDGTLVFHRESEGVVINDASDSNFRMTVQHWPSPDELYYEKDHLIVSTMSVSINGDDSEKFSYPQSFDIDTHLADGSANPDYPGTLYVDVTCDSRCDCDMVERLPTCELKAELSFPDFADGYYGYAAEEVTVSKHGHDDECGYFSPMTEWGCFSSGDAYIKFDRDTTDDYYNNINSQQLLNIPDASDGEFFFTVKFYDNEKDPYYDDFDKFRSLLNISVNDEVKGTYKHKLNTDDSMYNGDGTVNEDYTSELHVVVTCNENCSCYADRIQAA
jgi:hypothetical protein